MRISPFSRLGQDEKSYQRLRKAVAACALLAAASFAVMAVLNFTDNIRQARTEKEYAKMSEIADIYSVNIRNRIDMYMGLTKTAASQINAAGGPKNPLVHNIMRSMITNTGLSALSMLFADGSFIAAEKELLPKPDFAVATQRKPSIKVRVLGEKEFLTVFVPMFDKNGYRTAHIRALVDVDRIRAIINQNVFNGRSNTKIVDRMGNTIIDSEKSGLLIRGVRDNLFETLRASKITSSTTLDAIGNALTNGRDVSFSFEHAGVDSLVFLRHIDIEDWFVCVTLPKSYIAESTKYIKQSAVFLVFLTVLLFIVIIAIILMAEKRFTKRLSEMSSEVERVVKNVNGGFFKFVLDDAMTLKYVNIGFAKIAGIDEEDAFLLYESSFLDTVHPSSREFVKAAMEEQTKFKASFDLRYDMICQDGRQVPVFCKLGVVQEDRGRKVVYGIIVDITETQKNLDDLRLSEEVYKIAISMSDVMVFEYDPVLHQFAVSDKIASKFGSPKKLFDFNLQFGKNDAFVSLIFSISKECPSSSVEFVHKADTGEKFFLKVSASGIFEEGDKLLKIVGVIDDITEEKEVEAKYVRALKFKDSLLNIYDRYYECDLTNDKLLVGAENLLVNGQGLGYFETMRFLIDNAVHPDDVAVYSEAALLDGIMSCIERGISDLDIRYRIIERDGIYCWKEAHVMIYKDPADYSLRTAWFIRNIEGKMQYEENLKYKAQHDMLTDLFTKHVTREFIEKKIDELRFIGDSKLYNAFFIIDLDDFKDVNDLMGHLFGDAIISEVAKKLKRTFRESDILGRIGGDEFAVFMSDVPDKVQIINRAEEVCRSIKAIGRGSIEKLKISASVGVAFFDKRDMTFDELYRMADIALYHSKVQGNGSFVVYDVNMGDELPASNINEVEPEAVSVQDNYPYDSSISHSTLKILYTARDLESSVKGVLEFAMVHFSLSRAYIFKKDKELDYRFHYLFEVCNEHTSSVKPVFVKNGNCFSDRPEYSRNFDTNGVFIGETAALCGQANTLFIKQQIAKVIQFAIMDKGEFIGFFGFDVCGYKLILTESEMDEILSFGRVLSMFVPQMFKDEEKPQDVTA